MPGYASTNDDVGRAFADTIQNLIKEIDQKNKIRGWIIDLRKNTGGNMHPMIAGLLPVNEGEIFGYFIKQNNKNPWHSARYKSMTSVGYSIMNKNARIAVLIGPRTSSSGEMTAISLIGRKNTRLFGQPTGGYTSANGMYQLTDGSTLLLASSYSADRNLKNYLGKINPDEIVKEDDSKDATLEAAQKWILD